jgi:hypothetical protein
MAKDKAKRNRRSQRSKGHRIGNRKRMEAMLELRRSNAAVPIPAGEPNEAPKHRSSRGQHWLDD